MEMNLRAAFTIPPSTPQPQIELISEEEFLEYDPLIDPVTHQDINDLF
ncbi:hypothetical protein [Corynebacterium canis]|nr:hypothetical protein [Corynebacterium canis]